MSLFPIFLKLAGRPCIVVGAGKVALEKIESLLKAGVRLRVVAPEALPEVRELAVEGSLVWLQREFEPSDIDGAFLVIAATNIPAVNHRVYELSVEHGILCNAVDDPPFCDFYFPSVVRRGDLQIAISTAGQSPALAQRLRRELDEELPEDLGDWVAQLGQLRRDVLALFPPSESRKQLLHKLAHRPICESQTCPSRQLAHAGRALAQVEQEVTR